MQITFQRKAGMIGLVLPAVPCSLATNRMQAGMKFTRARSSHPIADQNGKARISTLLSMHGTLDALRGGIRARHKIEAITITTYRLKRNAK